MNKIEELLEKLCPNGVEYKTIGEIAKIQRGASPRPIKYYRTKEQNGINWIKIGDVEEGAKYITSTHEKITEEGAKNSRYIKKGSLILSNSMSFGRPYILAIDGCIHDGWLHLSNFEQFYKTDFLYFLLNSNKIQDEFKKKANFGGAVQNLNADIVRNIILPVPPLEIQCEIVRILDKFTELIALLKAELKARKLQYEYYREKILNNKNVDYKTLKELATNCDNLRKPVTSVDREKGDYPYYGASGIIDYVNDYIFDGDYLLISEDGANLVSRKNPIAFSIKGKNWVNNHAHVLKFENKYIQKYVEIYLNYIKLDKYITRAAQPKLNQENLNKIIIPIPNDNNNELKWIVDILSNFEKLCNDLTEGIPAEIEARQKQYEYYRDKLLTFKELKNN